MGSGAIANVASAGGDLAETGHQDVLCEAFKEAMNTDTGFCSEDEKTTRQKKNQGGTAWKNHKKKLQKQGKYPPKDFNDHFYASLSSKNPSLASELSAFREEAGVVTSAGPQLLSEMANGTGPLANKANQAINLMAAGRSKAASGVRSWAGQRGSQMGKIRRVFGERYGRPGNRFFLDGKFNDGTVLELKGPGDAENGENQFKDYKEASVNKKLAIVSCESCGADCADGNECP